MKALHKYNIRFNYLGLKADNFSLQRLRTEGSTQQFISGSGPEVTPVTAVLAYSKFDSAEHGLSYFFVDKDRFNAKMISHTGKVLYETTLRKV